MESRFKGKNRLIFWERDDIKVLDKVVDKRIRYHNFVLRHLTFENKPSIKYLK